MLDTILTPPEVPVPVIFTVVVKESGVSVTVTIPVLEPIAPGVNVTLIVQLAPPANVAPQVVVFPKSEELVPDITIELIVAVDDPELDIVMTEGEDATPTA